MHFLILVIMIALVPLRGWTGEVMATQMASSLMVHAHKQDELTIKLGANKAHIYSDNALFKGEKFDLQSQDLLAVAKVTKATAHDCDTQAKADDAAPADAHCDSCPACQACHTVALSAAAVSLNPAFSSRTLPRPAAAHFVSAIAALGQKPPIS